MNSLDFSFEPSPWEAWLRTKQMGDSVSAAELLTLLEEEPQQAAEDALQEMEMACMTLDISGLSRNVAAGEAAVRLKQEMQLAAGGLDPGSWRKMIRSGFIWKRWPIPLPLEMRQFWQQMRQRAAAAPENSWPILASAGSSNWPGSMQASACCCWI